MNLHHWPGLFAVLFLAIVFLQSGLDKVMNFKKELAWVRQKFSKNILQNYIGLLFSILTFSELISGIIAAAGVALLFFKNDPSIAVYGAWATCLTVIMLIFGQRFTKDYTGAATLVPYFIVAVLGLYFLV